MANTNSAPSMLDTDAPRPLAQPHIPLTPAVKAIIEGARKKYVVRLMTNGPSFPNRPEKAAFCREAFIEERTELGLSRASEIFRGHGSLLKYLFQPRSPRPAVISSV